MQPQIENLKPGARIHLIAVCGTGMGSLALMLQAAGYAVAGSDANVYPPMSDLLAGAGVAVSRGFSADNIRADLDLVIVGNVVSRGNPEVEALLAGGLPYLSLPEALARFFIRDLRSLVVAGTHGKTTATALCAWLLQHAQLDPSMMVGGVAANFGTNWRLGAGGAFVIEGDEYDSAFFDKGPKFLHYRPLRAILTSVEFDHADIYRDYEHYRSRFVEFLGLIPPAGLLAVCGDSEGAAQTIRESGDRLRCPVLRYGLGPHNDLAAAEIEDDGTALSFELVEQGRGLGRVRSPLPGGYNVQNALGAFAVCRPEGLSFEQFAAGLALFKSVMRRQQVIADHAGVTVIDDFAHHPTAVRETLSALRARYAGRRLIAVFEPRSNTSRRNIYQDEFASAFGAADLSLISAVDHPEKIPDGQRLDTDLLARRITENTGKPSSALAGPEAIFDYLRQAVKPGDVVALMSNGGFGGLGRKLADWTSAL